MARGRQAMIGGLLQTAGRALSGGRTTGTRGYRSTGARGTRARAGRGAGAASARGILRRLLR